MGLLHYILFPQYFFQRIAGIELELSTYFIYTLLEYSTFASCFSINIRNKKRRFWFCTKHVLFTVLLFAIQLSLSSLVNLILYQLPQKP